MYHLKRHFKVHENCEELLAAVQGNEKKEKCPICGEVFQKRFQVKQHKEQLDQQLANYQVYFEPVQLEGKHIFVSYKLANSTIDKTHRMPKLSSYCS